MYVNPQRDEYGFIIQDKYFEKIEQQEKERENLNKL